MCVNINVTEPRPNISDLSISTGKINYLIKQKNDPQIEYLHGYIQDIR